MKNRMLRKNGFEVSEVGLGCWQIGADWGSEISKSEAEQILNRAFENGITFYDTADAMAEAKNWLVIF